MKFINIRVQIAPPEENIEDRDLILLKRLAKIGLNTIKRELDRSAVFMKDQLAVSDIKRSLTAKIQDGRILFTSGFGHLDNIEVGLGKQSRMVSRLKLMPSRLSGSEIRYSWDSPFIKDFSRSPAITRLLKNRMFRQQRGLGRALQRGNTVVGNEDLFTTYFRIPVRGI